MDYQTPSVSYQAKLTTRKDNTKQQRAPHGDGDRFLGVKTPASERLKPMLGIRRAHSVAKSQNILNHDVSRRENYRGNTSHCRRKGSNEVMGQEGLRSDANNPGLEHSGIPNAREGRHFTVGNVGNNGKLYLRCVRIVLMWCT